MVSHSKTEFQRMSIAMKSLPYSRPQPPSDFIVLTAIVTTGSSKENRSPNASAQVSGQHNTPECQGSPVFGRSLMEPWMGPAGMEQLNY